MRAVYFKDMKARRCKEAIAVGQEERVQVIHQLRQIGHVNFISMSIEGVESEGGYERIAQATHLLEEMPFIDLGPFRVPSAPFVDHELDLVLVVEFAQGRPLVENEALQSIRFVEHLVPLVVRELQRMARRSTIVMR